MLMPRSGMDPVCGLQGRPRNGAPGAWLEESGGMSGLGGLNRAPDGVLIGLVQLHNPVVATPADAAAQTDRICALVARARRNLPTLHLVVFPDYALHGHQPGDHVPDRWTGDRPITRRLHRERHLGLLLHDGAEPGRHALRHRPHHRCGGGGQVGRRRQT